MKYEAEETRIPEVVDGIQVNFCKNPRCPNFGVPASTEQQPRGAGAKERGRDAYTVRGTLGHGSTSPCLLCSNCNESPSKKISSKN